MSFDVKTKLRLFDSLISPILLYASDVWGIFGYDHIDKIHIKFCKNLLGVRAQTSNFTIYGDLGCSPLSVIAKEISVKYLLKLLSNKNSLMLKIFQFQIEGFDVHMYSLVDSGINVTGLRVLHVYSINSDLVICG